MPHHFSFRLPCLVLGLLLAIWTDPYVWASNSSNSNSRSKKEQRRKYLEQLQKLAKQRTQIQFKNDSDGIVENAPKVPKGVAAVGMKPFAGRLFIPIRINGKIYCVGLLDTGSEVTILNTARVKVPGLRLGAVDNSIVGSTVGAVSARKTSLTSLAIGEQSISSVRLLALNHPANSNQFMSKIDMIVGMDFLSRWRITCDFQHGRFLVWPAGSKLPKPADSLEREQFRSTRLPGEVGNRPRVQVDVNGKFKVFCLLDTGWDVPQIVLYKKPKTYGLAYDVGRPIKQLRVSGAQGEGIVSSFSTTFPSLKMGKFNFKNVKGAIMDASAGVPYSYRKEFDMSQNVVGTPFFLRLSALHIEMRKSLIHMDRKIGNEDPPPPGTPGLSKQVSVTPQWGSNSRRRRSK